MTQLLLSPVSTIRHISQNSMREQLQITVSSSVDTQDIKVTSTWDLTSNKRIPVLHHQNQSFRLLNVLPKNQPKEVQFIWWHLTDNLGKVCLLLKGNKSYSIWEQVDEEQVLGDKPLPWESDKAAPALLKAGFLLLQATHAEISYLLGAKYADFFERDIAAVFHQYQFPQADLSDITQQLLKIDPLIVAHMVVWQEQHLATLLQELHSIALKFFGNEAFTIRVLEALDDLSPKERAKFTNWLREQPVNGKLWKSQEYSSNV